MHLFREGIVGVMFLDPVIVALRSLVIELNKWQLAFSLAKMENEFRNAFG